MIEVTSLIENTASSCASLHYEHGLSLYIKSEEWQYLIDTGASDHALKNAANLNIDLSTLTAVIITHNHYDHTGGLQTLLESNQTVKVYIKRAAQGHFYSRSTGSLRNIGGVEELIVRHPERFVFIDDDLTLAPNLHLLSNHVNDPRFVSKTAVLLQQVDGAYIPDTFQHELFVVVDAGDSLIVLSSCSHNGIVNIVRTVQQRFPQKPIRHIIGGFHLSDSKASTTNCSPADIQEIAKVLDESCSHTIYTCHCTGMLAYNMLREHLGDKIDYLSTGDCITITKRVAQ